ncbi:MAG: hypothetical protein JXA51_03080 [Dehalococcoidales bacterium]|nr:hypothetical protein [Dehalococcoidales bacterium]
MRDYIAGLCPLSSEPIEKGRRAVTRSNILSKEYLSHTKSHPTLIDDDGQPRLLFYFDNEELNKWLSRIVKGLFYHENHRSISHTAIITAKALPKIQPQPSDTFPYEKGLERRPYFIYGVVPDDNDVDKEHWVLIFYDKIVFLATVYTPQTTLTNTENKRAKL